MKQVLSQGHVCSPHLARSSLRLTGVRIHHRHGWSDRDGHKHSKERKEHEGGGGHRECEEDRDDWKCREQQEDRERQRRVDRWETMEIEIIHESSIGNTARLTATYPINSMYSAPMFLVVLSNDLSQVIPD